ncbi:MAG: GtrA family protein, partial [Granulosicoccaceae bacterium]
KKIVFRSQGRISTEGVRYIGAFLFSFGLNLLALQLLLETLHWNVNPAQVLAACTYTTSMYLLSRWLVFRNGMTYDATSK